VIFQRELTLATAPAITPNAIKMVGPVLLHYGSEDQKAHYLPRIRTGEDWWAQGYSEPGAGSDLASLKCEAVRQGDEYVINGSKIWTTHAHFSNKIFCLVRTDASGAPQHGITFLLFDLDLPGIEISPLLSISGDHEFNQVFFTDVRVPVSGLVGEENDGWSVAKYLLQHERGGKSATALAVRLDLLKHYLAARQEEHGSALTSDAAYARHLNELEIAMSAFASFENRVFASVETGAAVGELSSMLKIRRTELKQRITELVMDAVDHYGLPYQPGVREWGNNDTPVGSLTAATAAPQYLNDRAASIYAGSNEIQRNILAKRMLGL
jgi:alkylation response protein AidB-like acyl-CoA dehydrogenase